MISRGEWRIATAVFPRRTVLRLVGASAVASVLSACGSKGTASGSGGLTAAVALGRFAAGSWTVTAPDAHFSTATLTVTEDGSWTGHFVPTPDPQYPSSPKNSSGTWKLSGTGLQISVDGLYGSDPEEGAATNVPASVSGDTSVQFDWTYGRNRPSTIAADYDAEAKKLTLTVKQGRGTRTLTAVRS